MATHPLAPAEHVVHAPNLTEKKIKLDLKDRPGEAAEKTPAAKKPPAEKKPAAEKPAREGGGRSEGFGQGSGQHGQSPTVVHNHYYNPGNVFHGNVTNSTVHGSGGAYVQGNVTGGNVAGRDINIGGGAGATSSESVSEARTAKTRAPRTVNVTPTTPTSRTAAGALGVGPRGRAEQAEAARQGNPRTFTPEHPAPAGLPGSQPRPQGGAPTAASGRPRAIGGAPVAPTTPKTVPPNAVGVGPWGTADRARAERRRAQRTAPPRTFALPGEGKLDNAGKNVITGEVDESKTPVTPPKTEEPTKTGKTAGQVAQIGEAAAQGAVAGARVPGGPYVKAGAAVVGAAANAVRTSRRQRPVTPPKTTTPTHTSLGEGGTQSGKAPATRAEQLRRRDERLDTGPRTGHNLLAAAALTASSVKVPDAVSRVASRASETRPHDDAIPMRMTAAAPSPASTSVFGGAANIGRQTVDVAPKTAPPVHEEAPVGANNRGRLLPSTHPDAATHNPAVRAHAKAHGYRALAPKRASAKVEENVA